MDGPSLLRAPLLKSKRRIRERGLVADGWRRLSGWLAIEGGNERCEPAAVAFFFNFQIEDPLKKIFQQRAFKRVF